MMPKSTPPHPIKRPLSLKKRVSHHASMPPAGTLHAKPSSPPPTPSGSDRVQYHTRWARPPIVLKTQDPLSRFVVFDGSDAPYIEPHFSATGVDLDYNALVEARWYEHLAEHYLKNSGFNLNRAGSELLVNTPVQLYLAHSRLARAQLEIGIYSKLLEQDIGQSLRGDFDRTMKLSLPEEGIYAGHTSTIVA